MYSTLFDLSDFAIGQRVQLSPATGLWMRGAKFGVVVHVGRRWVDVRMDVTGKVVPCSPRLICEIL
jgi:hypothetical protein